MNYNKKTVRDVDVAGKKVLLRCDFNVPMAKDGSGVITDDKRIVAALPTIQYLLDQNAAVIACSHLGKPAATFESYAKKQAEKGKEAKKEDWEKSLKQLSLAPVAKRLSELLGKEVIMAADVVGPDAQAKAAALQPGQIMLLENTRFEKGETKNDPTLAKAMADMAQVYVSDAFGAVHRAHASTAGVADYLPAVSGFLIQKELEIIGGALANPKRPLVAILGGSKVSSKIGVINNLLNIADTIIIGGGMAYTFAAAQGGQVGDSLLEADWEDYANDMVKKAAEKGVKLLLPVDTVIADAFAPDANSKIVKTGEIPAGWQGFFLCMLMVIWLRIYYRIGSYFGNIWVAVYIMIVEHKRLQKISLKQKILYCFTWPIYDIIERYVKYLALFVKVEWKTIPHNSTVTIDDLAE